MTALPPITDFTGANVTEGDFKTALSNMHLFLSGLLGLTGEQNAAQTAMGVILGAGADLKVGAYTVAIADRGRVIACNGTFTITLPDASVVGSGFAVAVANYGTGTITIDPFSTQTIDGATTKNLTANTMMVACAVAGEWLSVGGVDIPNASTSQAGIVQLSTSISSTSTTLAATASAAKTAYDRGTTALNTAISANNNAESRVPKDSGFNTVGSSCFAIPITTTSHAAGSTIAGSSLRAAAAGLSGGSTALSGTWRCLGFVPDSSVTSLRATLWQRIS